MLLSLEFGGPPCIQFASPALQGDREFVLAAIDLCRRDSEGRHPADLVLPHSSLSARNDPEVIRRVIIWTGDIQQKNPLKTRAYEAHPQKAGKLCIVGGPAENGRGSGAQRPASVAANMTAGLLSTLLIAGKDALAHPTVHFAALQFLQDCASWHPDPADYGRRKDRRSVEEGMSSVCPQLSALNCLPSTVCPQLSALNCLPSTVCPQLLFALN